ncbi:hypothetical protein QLZ26_10990 [Cronobacter universalis]|uniref:hypothetical protein n=1 Tax=Cronobacter universalis TaxID=535744 RepID=UPI0024AF8DF7|nr:hypothetical protein [Cronobacter universalis]MDI7660627.1 hypothetical protein [Cronobacter universalis]
MGSGNGADNAHNNQFGGGGRGPTGGVNMGSGSSGNSSDRGNGGYVLSPAKPGEVAGRWVNGEFRIEVSRGMNWVSDNSIHWSDGKKAGKGETISVQMLLLLFHQVFVPPWMVISIQ